MYLEENKRLSTFGARNSNERGGASPSLLTGFHELSIFIKAMDDESCLFFVVCSLSVFVLLGLRDKFAVWCFKL